MADQESNGAPEEVSAHAAATPSTHHEKPVWFVVGRRLAVLCVVAATGYGAVRLTGIDPKEMLDSLGKMAEKHGVSGVLGAVGVESIGIPLPGEAVYITAEGAQNNLVMWPVLVGAAATGGFVGAAAQYFGARKISEWVVPRLNDKWQMELKLTRLFFRKFGGPGVAIGRFLPVVRSYTGLAAGSADMPRGKFLMWNLGGAAVWSAWWGTVGYFGGNALVSLPPAAKSALAGVGVVALVGALTAKEIASRKFAAKASATYPGRLEDYDRQARLAAQAQKKQKQATKPGERGDIAA